MNEDWQEEEKDTASGRVIYAREVPHGLQGNYGTYDFALAREFQVRSPSGEVLLQTSGSAQGEYWCGVFLFFIDGSKGTKVRLEESDRQENTILEVSDMPLALEKVWK